MRMFRRSTKRAAVHDHAAHPDSVARPPAVRLDSVARPASALAAPTAPPFAPNTRLVRVTVPANLSTGSSFLVDSPGIARLMVTVPEGAGPGVAIHVAVPPEAVNASRRYGGPLPEEARCPEVDAAVKKSLAAVLKENAYLPSKRPPAEFAEAASVICLSRGWLMHTSLYRHQATAAAAVRAKPTLKTRRAFETHLVTLIRKGWSLSSDDAARTQACAVHGRKIFEVVTHLYSINGAEGNSKGHAVCWAVSMLAEYSSADSIVAKMAEIADRVNRCSSAQKQAYNLLLVAAGRLADAAAVVDAAVATAAATAASPEDWGQLEELDGAVARVHAVFEDFLDDHKERAYASAFDEPARFYFDARGDHGARDHVKVHGSNWYAVALHEALGVSTPYVPEEDDPHKMAVAAFWGGLHPSAWELFSQRDHFGKEFEGIPALRRKSKHLKGHVDAGVFDAQRPKALRAKLQTNANARRQFAPYAERFAHFFSTEFLARSAFETLNSEV